jgi:hypothetical protein
MWMPGGFLHILQHDMHARFLASPTASLLCVTRKTPEVVGDIALMMVHSSQRESDIYRVIGTDPQSPSGTNILSHQIGEGI